METREIGIIDGIGVVESKRIQWSKQATRDCNEKDNMYMAHGINGDWS
jgi:hypothetical protein